MVASQASDVQVFVSSHGFETPGLQTPPPQVSPVVHGLPSSHGAVLLVNTHPVAGPTQLSVVQGLLSSQTTAVCVHEPSAGTQASVVQTSPSLQLTGAPGMQVPPTHVSVPLQRLPS